MADRPLIAIPARFSESASALRYRAEVTSRALIEAVYAAGGEPLVVHPCAPSSSGEAMDTYVAQRVSWSDAVLLPGGGDLDASWSGQSPHASLYDVDVEQDAFDLALARVALAQGLPLLAICRGAQVVTVATGGRLIPDLASAGRDAHRHLRHEVRVESGSLLDSIVGTTVPVSCFHHQAIERLGDEAMGAAWSADGVIEAIELPQARGWFLGLQWHPEDTWSTDPRQRAVFEAFVAAARERSLSRC